MNYNSMVFTLQALVIEAYNNFNRSSLIGLLLLIWKVELCVNERCILSKLNWEN